ncbi:hypothetical protein CDN99_12080 [Roseateles aquatilis]|uniref:PASTA domain-containing protein n=1 Tax=Roseateles aquatilis TaxID=431061 RepID=A0A246JE22_9BURK|nr:PASTA domain-containing protein [Roseateles aquatilis]OWQ90892.1 hypothetical protein CDN99_12080 [Roseateles aquatilis]
MINVMQGAVAAAMMQSAKQPPDRVLAIAALSALTPGVLGLALPLAVLGQRAAAPTTPAPLPAPLVLVPDVRGQTVKEAQSTLKAGGFAAVVVERDVTGSVYEPGTIAVQDPEADEAVDKGTTVHLIVLPDSSSVGTLEDL